MSDLFLFKQHTANGRKQAEGRLADEMKLALSLEQLYIITLPTSDFLGWVLMRSLFLAYFGAWSSMHDAGLKKEVDWLDF
jgi:hypothetical protein